jgi:Papain family cysteine protease
MKIRTWAVSATSALLLGLAVVPPSADAAPPTVAAPATQVADAFYSQREAVATAAIRARLAIERQRVQANHLGYIVAYTTAMDRPPAALRGGAIHADLAQRMVANAPKSAAWLQAIQAKRAQGMRAKPRWPTPGAEKADLREVLSGKFNYYASLSQNMPVPSGQSAVPPIKDQNNCGSCFAFGPTTAFEWSALLLQDIFGGSANESTVVSPQSALSCAHAGAGGPNGDTMDECANGGFADDVLRWMTEVGAQKESEYPYADADVCCGPPNNGFKTPSWCTAAENNSSAQDGGNGYCRNVPACKGSYAADEKAFGWGYLNNSSAPPTTAELKSWISNYGAIVVAVSADGWDAYGGGVFNNPYARGTDHIVVLVGWNDKAGSGAWIVQNSWGTGWGETCGFGTTKGYMYLQYGSSNVGALALWVSAP